MTKLLRGLITLFGAAGFLAVSAVSAFAGEGYASGGVAGESTGGGGSLPFTGAEIGALSALGLAAVGGGAALTVAGRRRRRAALTH